MAVGEMALEYIYDCRYDSLTLYDGSTDNSTVLKQLCFTDTISVTSSDSTVLVVFKSDSSVNAGRFSFSWTFVEQGGGDQGDVMSSTHLWWYIFLFANELAALDTADCVHLRLILPMLLTLFVVLILFEMFFMFCHLLYMYFVYNFCLHASQWVNRTVSLQRTKRAECFIRSNLSPVYTPNWPPVLI